MGMFRNDAFLWRTTLVTGFILLITLVILSVFFDKFPHTIPLWVTLPWGEGQLAPAFYLWMLLGLTIGVWIGNLIFARLFFRTPAVSRLFVGTTALLASMTLAVVVRLIGVFFV